MTTLDAEREEINLVTWSLVEEVFNALGMAKTGLACKTFGWTIKPIARKVAVLTVPCDHDLRDYGSQVASRNFIHNFVNEIKTRGTETIPRVDKIVGPGNAYVTAAKREVFGQVDIDMIAGPSEVVILASAESNPRFIAADMLSQAEHDEAACSICFTDSMPHAMLVRRELEIQLESLQRKKIARKSLENFGAIVVMDSYIQSTQWINEIAPEHLEIFASIPMSAIDKVSTDEFPLDTLAANRGTSGERLIDARAACLCPVFDPK